MCEESLKIETTSKRKEKPKTDQLPFGRIFTDHMFVMDYEEGSGWHSPRIVPYGPFSIEPAAMVFHYGQTVFEGLKAYRTKDGRILLFRPEKNFERLNRSCERMRIPPIDEKKTLHYLLQLIRLEREWVPDTKGTSLYIRPFIISTENHLAVAPSRSYRFMIILSPVGSYFPGGLEPVRILVENEYTRAVKGGTGAAKTGGNYSAAYRAQARAIESGHADVLWLDGIEKKYIEEVGSMNIFFKIHGEVVTPALSGSILDGVTRRSVIELLGKWGIRVRERRISIHELFDFYEKGMLEEAFGTGTAAVVSPVGELNWEGRKMMINRGKIGELSQRLYQTITGIQTGELQDRYGWTMEVCREEPSVTQSSGH